MCGVIKEGCRLAMEADRWNGIVIPYRRAKLTTVRIIIMTWLISAQRDIVQPEPWRNTNLPQLTYRRMRGKGNT